MLSISNSITINRPLSQVFAFVSDQRNNPKWNYYVMSVEKTNEIKGVGAEYLQTRKSDQQKFGVVVFKVNKRLVIQSILGQRLKVRREFIFEGNEKQTIIYDQIDFKVPLPKFLSSLILKGPRNGVKQNLAMLKQLLETGHVVLQDGREVLYK
ncbi:SRPBCC family protein [Ekhidna sp.]|uniref:SRPBCC family protein n=1 Tax=Ekhidna sp. TaxID=2608089 RepID=UPI003298904D